MKDSRRECRPTPLSLSFSPSTLLSSPRCLQPRPYRVASCSSCTAAALGRPRCLQPCPSSRRFVSNPCSSRRLPLAEIWSSPRRRTPERCGRSPVNPVAPFSFLLLLLLHLHALRPGMDHAGSAPYSPRPAARTALLHTWRAASALGRVDRRRCGASRRRRPCPRSRSYSTAGPARRASRMCRRRAHSLFVATSAVPCEFCQID